MENFFHNLKQEFFSQKFIFKKYWGQSFLIDENIIQKIVKVANLKSTDYCLEIGAGAGFLSWALAEKVKELIVIEKDKELIDFLKNNLAQYKNLKIINADFLKIDLTTILTPEKKYKIIANLPYAIASLCINKILTNNKYFKVIYLMLQSEIAKRIVSKPANKVYGSLSVFVQYFCETEILFKVSANCFYPKPKVESSFIFLQPYKISPYLEINTAEFSKFLKYCFSKRRKKLKNIIFNFVNEEKKEKLLIEFSNFLKQRPEELKVNDFVEIFKFINANNN